MKLNPDNPYRLYTVLTGYRDEDILDVDDWVPGDPLKGPIIAKIQQFFESLTRGYSSSLSGKYYASRRIRKEDKEEGDLCVRPGDPRFNYHAEADTIALCVKELFGEEAIACDEKGQMFINLDFLARHHFKEIIEDRALQEEYSSEEQRSSLSKIYNNLSGDALSAHGALPTWQSWDEDRHGMGIVGNANVLRQMYAILKEEFGEDYIKYEIAKPAEASEDINFAQAIAGERNTFERTCVLVLNPYYFNCWENGKRLNDVIERTELLRGCESPHLRM